MNNQIFCIVSWLFLPIPQKEGWERDRKVCENFTAEAASKNDTHYTFSYISDIGVHGT